MELQKYSLERYRAAPEINLTAEETSFLAEYNERLERIIERVRGQETGQLKRLVVELFRPEAWRVLMHLSKAEQAAAKAMDSKTGLEALAKEEAEALNAEYDRRAAAVVAALQEFGDFVEGVNGRVASPSSASSPSARH